MLYVAHAYGTWQQLSAELRAMPFLQQAKAVLATSLTDHRAVLQVHDWPIMVFSALRLLTWLLARPQLQISWPSVCQDLCVALICLLVLIKPAEDAFTHLFKRPKSSRLSSSAESSPSVIDSSSSLH